MHPSTPTEARPRNRGFSLVEVMVAITIFAIIALAAYAIYDAARWSFQRGSNASDAQQRTRIGFDRMVSDIRIAGYDYNTDGDQTAYLDQSDEQMEYLGPTVVAFRANFDKEDDQGGREYDPTKGEPTGTGPNAKSGYETSAAWLDDNPSAGGFPVVTTANDEIVIYALTKPGVNEQITLKLDTTKPRDSVKDWLGEGGDAEETITICNLALTHDDPPYTLTRITFADQNIGDTGNACLASNLQIRTPLADGIRSLSFDYFDSKDQDYYCVDQQTDGTCSSADQIAFVDVGGEDDLNNVDLAGRSARKKVRRVAIELVGMTEDPDFRYTDPLEDDPTSSAARHRKTRLLADVAPPNLGRVGQVDLLSIEPTIVEGVEACSGQCGFLRVLWEQNPREEQILGYVVDVFEVQCGTTTVLTKVASKFVAGQEAYDRDGFLYTTFTGAEEPDFLDQAREAVANRPCLAVQVTAKNVNGEDGPPSDSNDATTDAEPTLVSNEPGAEAASKLYDETRPDPVSDFWATGYDSGDQDTDGDTIPDTNTGINPETDTGGDYYPQTNAITLSWTAPSWTLNENSSNEPVTQVGSGTNPALGQGSPSPGCHVEEDADGNPRTPLEEVNGEADVAQDLKDYGVLIPGENQEGRYLIFRSTEPNFKPEDHHLIAAVETSNFEDTTVHHYKQQGGTETFQYTEAFPVENCVTYYYRIRVADDCWDGTNPAGVDLPNGDYSHPNLSPFYPPLNPSNPADTDNLPSGTTAGAAVMGYARPSGRPEAPTNLALDAYDSGNNDFIISFHLPKRSIDSDASHIAMGTVRVYSSSNSETFTPPEGTCSNPPCPMSGGNTWYWGEIEPHTDPTGGRPVAKDDAGTDFLDPDEAGILRLVIGHHDEDGDNAGPVTPPATWGVELPVEDESAINLDGNPGANDSGDTALKMSLQNSNTHWFKLVGVQCKDTQGQNFVTAANEDQGVSSQFLEIPCEFGQAKNGDPAANGAGGTIANQALTAPNVDDTPDSDVSLNCPSSLPGKITALVTDPVDGDIRACQARLVLRAGVSGDVVSSDWRYWSDPGLCNEVGASTGCPDGQSFYSTNEFCWTESMVSELMESLRGQDIQVMVQVRESIPKPKTEDITIWTIPCMTQEECPVVVPADSCLLESFVQRDDDGLFSTQNPLMQNDDFTGGVDPISGQENGLPDGTIDCYQAVHWTYEEICSNGPLDIKRIRMQWQPDVVGACTGNLLRAFWNYQSPDEPGVEIFESSNWPDAGNTSGDVEVCDSDVSCSNQVSCVPEDCDNGIDDDGDGSTDCQDIDCREDAACENCNDSIDNDGDGDIDCDDEDCEGDGNCGGEFCANGVDDDNDGATDCADVDCIGSSDCGGGFQCLHIDADTTATIRMEFDDVGCAESMRDAEIEVEIEYERFNLTGNTDTLTQTFTFSPTVTPIPDLCAPCDQDSDGVIAQFGEAADGTPCGGTDCDDLDPDVGATAGADCCDVDGDGFEPLGRTITLADGSTKDCGNSNKDSCNDPSSATGPSNDCNDNEVTISPNRTESQTLGNCDDGVDNDCDCVVDGVDPDGDPFNDPSDPFECL